MFSGPSAEGRLSRVGMGGEGVRYSDEDSLNYGTHIAVDWVIRQKKWSRRFENCLLCEVRVEAQPSQTHGLF